MKTRMVDDQMIQRTRTATYCTLMVYFVLPPPWALLELSATDRIEAGSTPKAGSCVMASCSRSELLVPRLAA